MSFALFTVVCESEEPFNVLVTWMLRRTPCANEFTNMADVGGQLVAFVIVIML